MKKINVILNFIYFIGTTRSVPDKNEYCVYEEQIITSESTLSVIRDWWKEMSVQKPIKCQTPKKWIYDSNVLKTFSGQIPVISYQCAEGEAPTQFRFQGKIKNSILNGPGKLKLGSEVNVDHPTSCLKINAVLGRLPISITGTFVGGLLNGNAKIVLEDGRVVVGHYVKGLADGLRREWDADGNLTYVGFSYKGGKVGKAWQRLGQSLIFSDVATLNRSDDPTIVIPWLKTSSKIMAGKFWHHISTLTEIFETQILDARPEDESCSLTLTFKLGNRQIAHFYDVRNSQLIDQFSNSEEEAKNCKYFYLTGGNVVAKLSGWFEKLNTFVESQTYHLLVLQMKQEERQPDKGVQLISSIVFNDEDSISGELSPSPATMNVTFFEKQKAKVLVSLVSFDSQQRLHGLVELQTIQDQNMSHRFGFELDHVIMFRAFFNHGVVEGPVQLGTLDGRSSLLMAKGGILHGPALFIGSVLILQDRLRRPLKKNLPMTDSKISFLGKFLNGKPSGNFWIRMKGDGFMHGRFNADGKGTGDDLAFIYPDMETALFGKFDDFVMKSAQEAEVAEAECDNNGMIAITKFTKLQGPEFYYRAPTNESFGAGPYGIVDPYERKFVSVAQSSILDSGDGVFALKYIPSGRCSCWYSGFMYDEGEQQEGYLRSCINNQSLTMDERRHCRKYSLDFKMFNTLIEIPPEFDEPGIFHPTIGPKVNNVRLVLGLLLNFLRQKEK